MKCPNCRKEGTLRPWEGKLDTMGVTIMARGERCSSCGDVTTGYDEQGHNDRQLAVAFAARGIRNGAEFKLVRKVAGFKATEIADLLGVRPETVSRWERDEVGIPRTAAFTVGELLEHPVVTRRKLEAFAS